MIVTIYTCNDKDCPSYYTFLIQRDFPDISVENIKKFYIKYKTID